MTNLNQFTIILGLIMINSTFSATIGKYIKPSLYSPLSKFQTVVNAKMFYFCFFSYSDFNRKFSVNNHATLVKYKTIQNHHNKKDLKSKRIPRHIFQQVKKCIDVLRIQRDKKDK